MITKTVGEEIRNSVRRIEAWHRDLLIQSSCGIRGIMVSAGSGHDGRWDTYVATNDERANEDQAY